ncbi:FRG domain-containing protein [Rugamonas sp. FT82W]|uniref:FRG domain-containing protein n=1 Tax=Duganella vulcania TaxID=2692166 RepID=A0A845FZ11_9BURK|nr:FRG domain-containing protein [Duganella vulcania]
MFNFLITSRSGAWDRQFYEYDRSRFLEYTNDEIAEALKDLTDDQKNVIMDWPCLFAYEGTQGIARIGRITRIKESKNTVLLEFEFDENYDPLEFGKIVEIAPLLDIREWELSRTHWAIKDEDLITRLSKAKIIRTPVIPKTSNAGGIPRSVKSDRKATSSVTSVNGFIGKIMELRGTGKETFFRGHSNRKKYKLEPSLLRKDIKGNYLYLQHEHLMYRELIISDSAEFSVDTCTLDRLVRMQHFSLPTRLLDITSNPLIALYFACKSNFGKLENGKYVGEDEGEVITFEMEPKQIKYYDSDTISCLANLVRLTKAEKDEIDLQLQTIDEFNAQPALKRLLHFIREEKAFFEPRILADHIGGITCVKGKRSNSRISSQSGAFLVFGLNAILDETGSSDFGVRRIAVKNKAEILKQLDLLNINERTVFPYIENSARYVAKKYAFQEDEK